MQWHHFIKNLINTLKVEDAMSNSFRNFHAKGLNYLCISRSPELIVKIYDIPGNVVSANKRHNVLLNPHTHGHNFHTILLRGKCENHNYKFIRRAIQPEAATTAPPQIDKHNRFSYISKLRDPENAGFKFKEVGDLILSSTEHLDKYGDSYYLDHTQIHAIRPQPGTTLLLLQYKDVDKKATEFYCQEDIPPIHDNLYQRYTLDETSSFINDIDRLCAKLAADSFTGS